MKICLRVILFLLSWVAITAAQHQCMEASSLQRCIKTHTFSLPAEQHVSKRLKHTLSTVIVLCFKEQSILKYFCCQCNWPCKISHSFHTFLIAEVKMAQCTETEQLYLFSLQGCVCVFVSAIGSWRNKLLVPRSVARTPRASINPCFDGRGRI